MFISSRSHFFRMIFLLVLLFSTAAAGQKKLLGAPDIVPPATADMQNPEFWISRIDGDPDRVIMTPKQIQALNEKNRTRPLIRKSISGKTELVEDALTQGGFSGIHYHMENPLTIESLTADSLLVWLNRSRDFISKGSFWDRRQIPVTDEFRRELIESIDVSSLPGTVHPRYGITVRHTLVRNVPTSVKMYSSQYGWLDQFQNAVLETGMPVAILHQSKEGDWFFVKAEYVFGWVPAENVGVGAIKKIHLLAEPENFIAAVDHRVPVYSDKLFTSWLSHIYMGARLSLIDKTSVGYCVQVPVRRADGSLDTVTGWIRPDADVSVGFQSYTQRNVITTIFSLLNRPYGWGGTDHERDCVGAIRAVFKTFGIFMPRWTTYELFSSDHVISFPQDTPKQSKYWYLDSCEPGITVCGFNWHVVLYLGKVDDVHYVIHQNGYSYHDEGGNEIRVGRVSVNYTELEGGADIGRWTELTMFKP